MEFVAAREFRVRPGSVWKKLKLQGEMVITSNGKPLALLRDIEGCNLEDEVQAGVAARGFSALRRIREKARHTGIHAMGEKEIDRIIVEARKTYPE